jgi:hypothetical protein
MWRGWRKHEVRPAVARLRGQHLAGAAALGLITCKHVFGHRRFVAETDQPDKALARFFNQSNMLWDKSLNHGHKAFFMSYCRVERLAVAAGRSIALAHVPEKLNPVFRSASAQTHDCKERQKDCHEHIDQAKGFEHRLCRQGHRPRRMGP